LKRCPPPASRTFRVDRISDAVVTDLAAERPTDFDLSTAWERVVDEVEQRRSLLPATVLIDARYLAVLRDQFGRHCDVDGHLDDGRVRYSTRAGARRQP
jgi:predicted DNA-binding transcriptional regulator YafY